MSAKKHDSSRKIGIEGEFFSFLVAIKGALLIKARLHHHSGSKEYVIAIVTKFQRLLLGAFRSANEVVGFALHPEMRRIICEIGEQSDEWHAGHGGADTFSQRAVKVWDHREHDIGRISGPILAQHIDSGAVIRAYDRLQDRKKLWRKAGPPLAENQVVGILNANASSAAQQIEPV